MCYSESNRKSDYYLITSKRDLQPRDLKLMAVRRVCASIYMTYGVFQCISPSSVLFYMFNPFMRHSTRWDSGRWPNECLALYGHLSKLEICI